MDQDMKISRMNLKIALKKLRVYMKQLIERLLINIKIKKKNDKQLSFIIQIKYCGDVI